MYNTLLFHLQAATPTKIGQGYKTETKAAIAQQQDSINKPNEAVIYGGSFSLFALLIGIIICLAKRRMNHKTENFFYFDPFNQIPCRKCQYFTGNFYLKCAVRPSNVLTNKAINCPDYCFKNKNDAGAS